MTQATQNRPEELRSATQYPYQKPANSGEADCDFQEMCDTVFTSVRTYSGQHPAILASVVFLAGFYLGWKTKPW
jgi:hypothetical protein